MFLFRCSYTSYGAAKLVAFWLAAYALGGQSKPLCRIMHSSPLSRWANCTVEIGGLAIQGDEVFNQKFGPTFQTYLTTVLNASHGLEFVALPLNFDQNFDYVGASELDFIYSNPAAYTCMMVEFDLTTVASLMNFRKGNSLDKFAGVMFALANASEFNNTQDLRNARVSAVSISGLGAMQLQQAELLKQGFNIMTDTKRLTFTGNQGQTVQDVQSGYADVGFVRTDMIDSLVASGLTQWEYFKVLNEIPDDTFPFKRSTGFTPEWPIGALGHVPNDVKELVLRALMDLDRDSPNPLLSEPAIQGSFSTWVPPMNYLGLLSMLESISYYDPSQRKCLRNSDVYQAVACPSGYVKQSQDVAFCQTDCKSGYTCLCEPCAKLRDPELVLRAFPLDTLWLGTVNTSELAVRTNFSPECKRMDLCALAASGQQMMWSLLDQVGLDNRRIINAPIITSVKIRLRFDGPSQVMTMENVTIDGLKTQRYVLNTSGAEIGTQVVNVQVNGQQALMSPVVVSYFAAPLKVISCPPGQELADTGHCHVCPLGSAGLGGYEDCKLCNPGSYQSLEGQMYCTACPAGTFAPSSGAQTCDPCLAGQSTQDKAGLKQCEACQSGTAAPVNGAERCTLCSRGDFSEIAGATKCEKCEGGQTTSDLGSVNRTMCVCRPGEYLSIGNTTSGQMCRSCPEHIACSMGTTAEDFNPSGPLGFSSKSTILQEGYFSPSDDPTSIFKCLFNKGCPGGPLQAGQANCPTGSGGFLCLSCDEGYVRTSNSCQECTSKDDLLIVVLVVIAVASLPLFLLVGARVPVKELPQGLMAVSIGGLLMFFIQTLATLSAVQVPWESPFKDMLQSLRFVGFDFHELGCWGSVSTQDLYILKMMLPIIAICTLALLAYACQLLRLKNVSISIPGFANAVGQVAMLLFITLCLVVLVPFQCYEHPNGKRSLVTAPAILCSESPAYFEMVVASAFGILVYLNGMVATVIYAVWRYPVAILGDGIRFVHMFRFLFRRFRPECYWFGAGILIRNLLLALFPMVVPPERAYVALLLVQTIMLLSLCASAWFKPWKAPTINEIDAILHMALLVIIHIGAEMLHSSGSSVITSWLACLLALICLISCAVLLLVKLWSALRPKAKFSIFLSHHKAAGACAARFLKLVLGKRVKGPLFYDCDCLTSLGDIFDGVKNSTAVLVILSGETLCRPWCVGEIVTAYHCNIPMQCVTIGSKRSVPSQSTVDKWLTLDEQGMQALFGKFEILRPHGICLEDVAPAMKKCLEKMPLHLKLADQDSFEATLGVVLSELCLQRPALVQLNQVQQAKSQQGSTSASLTGDFLLMSDVHDSEATAAARVLKLLIQGKTQKQVVLDAALSLADFKKFLQCQSASCIICWLITSQTMKSPVQLARLALLFKLWPTCVVAPVLIGDALFFPDGKYYEALEKTGGELGPGAKEQLSKLAEAPVELSEVAGAVRRVLENIAYIVNVAHANEAMLNVAVNSLLDGCTALYKKSEKDAFTKAVEGSAKEAQENERDFDGVCAGTDKE